MKYEVLIITVGTLGLILTTLLYFNFIGEMNYLEMVSRVVVQATTGLLLGILIYIYQNINK